MAVDIYTLGWSTTTNLSLLLDMKLCLRSRNCRESQEQSSAYKTKTRLSPSGFTDCFERVNKANELAYWSHGSQGLHNPVMALAGQSFGVSTSLPNFSGGFSGGFLKSLITILNIPTAQATHVFLDDYFTQIISFLWNSY